MTASPRVSLPVAVIMGRRMVSRGRWSVPSWRVVGVVAGKNLPGGDGCVLALYARQNGGGGVRTCGGCRWRGQKSVRAAIPRSSQVGLPTVPTLKLYVGQPVEWCE